MNSTDIVRRLGLTTFTPAQWYLLLGGWFMFTHAIADVVFYEQSTAVGTQAVADSHMFFGTFQLNLWHSVAEFASSITFLVLAFSKKWSALGALANGILYTLLFAAFYAFSDNNVLFGVMVENETTNLFHLVLALGAFITYWFTIRRPNLDPTRRVAN